MRDPNLPSVSGWCSGPNGCDSRRAHKICQGRLDAELLARCGCEGHEVVAADSSPETTALIERIDHELSGGPKTPVVERDSRRSERTKDGQKWDNRDGPSGVVSATRPGPDHHSARTGRG